MHDLYQLALAFLPHLPEPVLTAWAIYKALFVLFVLTVAALATWSAHLRGKLSGFTLYGLAAPLLTLFIIIDVVAQYTIACVVFTGLPRSREYTVSRRLSRLLNEEGVSTPRGRRAIKLARFILAFDSTGHTFGGALS